MGVGVASIAKIMTEFFDDRTHIENLLYKLNDEVNGDADYSRVPGRLVHSKIDKIKFWKPSILYPIFNSKLFISSFSRV